MKRLFGTVAMLMALTVMADGLSTAEVRNEPKCLKEWTFDNAETVAAWSKKTNFVSNVRLEDGVMKGTISDWDPWLTGPEDRFKATPWQYVEIEMKSSLGGDGQIFFTDTNESQYDGFSPSLFTSFSIIGDNEWHTYVVNPFWQQETILKLRLDFAQSHRPEDKGNRTFEVRRIRVMDPGYEKMQPTEWQWDFTKGGSEKWQPVAAEMQMTDSGILLRRNDMEKSLGLGVTYINVPVEEHGFWLCVQMACVGAERATVTWLSSKSNGLRRKTFRVLPDGKMRFYNVDMSSEGGWNGDIYKLAITLNGKKASQMTVKGIEVADGPGGPVQLSILVSGLTNGLNRAGRECEFMVRVTNDGGEAANNLKIKNFKAPESVALVLGGGDTVAQTVEPFDVVDYFFKLKSDYPVHGRYAVTLEDDNGNAVTAEGMMEITKSLGLPRAAYVPEPQPVDTGDYEIGALYFPGWDNRANGGWQRVFARCPERKPILGWYDEANPECVDWQIKWLVENGIQYLLVDWYWSKGQIGLEHWIRAFKKAKYRKYMKWAMMWANHNAPGSHSEEDMVAVTKYWIDNYFNMPEYYKIDGKPVVMMWSVANMDRDLADKGGAARLIEIAQETARAAGLPGIHFSAMKWPEANVTEKMIQSLKDKGFESTSIYHYMWHGNLAEDNSRFPFELVAVTNKDLWKRWHEVGILPYFMNLSTGWDDRPWNDHLEIYGRTPELFQIICKDAKEFADKTNHKKQILLSPLNEWGEGSYAEPNREFGFGMYEAVRDTFAKMPKGGWPLNYGPEDVGLGPYDITIPKRVTYVSRSSWDFDDKTAQGWKVLMGIESCKPEDGNLVIKTKHWDPAITTNLGKLRAKKYKTFTVRMKTTPNADGKPDKAQLFWATTTNKIVEAASVIRDVPTDGQYHDIVFDLTQNKRFSGILTELRFDPSTRENIEIVIDSMKLE
ncbi:MAG: glycoside hydrolase family 99-like domain-containing protein [Victivallales bacterium]|nr:glycoside hydrolase family 99-like domain-containing protein [Victivallales bacterium]